jgi:hypothetical protein
VGDNFNVTQPPDPHSPIQYRNWKDDAPVRQRRVGYFVLGFFMSAVVVFVCGFVWGMANFNPHGGIRVREWRGPSICSVFGLALLLWPSAVIHRRGGKAFLAGLITGFCATMIFEGICFRA